MAGKKRYDPIEDRNIKISGSEGINIDPVYINVSIRGQVSDAYEKIGLILATAQSGGRLTRNQVNDVHNKVHEIVNLAKEAVKKYVANKNDERKEELRAVLIILKKAKSAERVIDMKYMLESEAPEVKERRHWISEWTKNEADRDNKNEGIKDIDVPIIDVERLLKEDENDR